MYEPRIIRIGCLGAHYAIIIIKDPPPKKKIVLVIMKAPMSTGSLAIAQAQMRTTRGVQDVGLGVGALGGFSIEGFRV